MNPTTHHVRIRTNTFFRNEILLARFQPGVWYVGEPCSCQPGDFLYNCTNFVCVFVPSGQWFAPRCLVCTQIQLVDRVLCMDGCVTKRSNLDNEGKSVLKSHLLFRRLIGWALFNKHNSDILETSGPRSGPAPAKTQKKKTWRGFYFSLCNWHYVMVRIIDLCESTIATALVVYSVNTNISTVTDSAYVENESAILTLYKCIIGTN